MDETIIICTKEELIAMHKRGEIEGNGYVITTEGLSMSFVTTTVSIHTGNPMMSTK
ncbi:hypothetical protein [Synechococcus phage S-SRP01]|uniref:Uncharacterized protein n=1 Tax=Synechococcus phage S-SRP01 TaxID=2781607 RepID=A0A874MA90_9CAUD|nr:hypothetical protein [Synechococcus phage S-SRP01]